MICDKLIQGPGSKPSDPWFYCGKPEGDPIHGEDGHYYRASPERLLTQGLVPVGRKLRNVIVRVTVTILDKDVIDANLVGSVLGEADMGFDATESSQYATVRDNARRFVDDALEAATASARERFEVEI